MFNYSLGITTALIFFYLFAGTFILFIVSLITGAFVRSVKYVDLLKIFFYALSPLLLFGWIPFLPQAHIIWSLFLFVIGVKVMKKHAKIRKTSIEHRD